MGPWLKPYDAEPDPALATRFHALERLPADTFGRAFADFYQINGYTYPGEPDALNFAFAVPHDSTHVLAGYDTTPRGELLTSTLTATMHRSHAMSGHVLPVILSWHLGIPLNDVAGSARGALDPQEFWHAWARGEDTTADLFAPDWNFWSAAIQPISAVREAVGLVAPI
jgi:ubiquinone biosynthesis protein Coq4